MRAFTIIGPSQSGKTTLARALASIEGRPSQAEIGPGLTFRSFSYLDEPWAVIDVAGGTENLASAAGALAGSDAAVLCVPPDPEAAPLAAPWLRLVEDSGVPCFLFVNRMDQAEARVRDTVAALQAYAAHIVVLRQVPIREGEHVTGAVDLISERAWHYNEGQASSLIEIPDTVRDREQEARTELLEHLADLDDALLEQLIEDRSPATAEVYDLVADLHRTSDIIVASLGAAAHGNGVHRLMKSLRHEAPDVRATRARLGLDPGVIAVGVAADQKKHVGKSVLLRAFGDAVAQGATVGGGQVGTLLAPSGEPHAGPLAPGAFGLAVRADHLDRGRAFAAQAAHDLPGWAAGPAPMLRRLLGPVHEKDDARLSAAIRKLAAVDPGLGLAQDETTGHVVAGFQGPMHLRAALERLDGDFGIAVAARPVPTTYRETIRKSVDRHYRHRKQSGGAGQFADVHLTVAPLPRGEGFRFDETVKGGAVPRNYIPAVEAGARDALATGPSGFPVVDVAVTLTDGKHHAVDSSDFAFRTAGAAGVREALREAGPVMLQPIDRVTIHLPSIYSGALVGLISSLRGQVQGFEAHPTARGWDIFRALLPAAMHDALHQALGGLAHGTATWEADLDHYEELGREDADRVRQAREAAPA